MGSSYDDGLKNADVAEGIEGVLTRFSSSFEPLDEYEAGRRIRNARGASSQALLERTVETSVITALLKRHGALHPPVAGAAGTLNAETDFEVFVARLAEGDRAGALALLAPLRHPFGFLDDRIVRLLGAAAQRLGSCWEEDRLCFAEVSLGLVTLQRLLHEFAPPPRATSVAERRMLLVPMPGEAHCFGLRILGIRFQQAGWDCRCESTLTEEALLRRVADEHFHVLGLSVQDKAGEERATDLIRRLRKASREPNLRILLGGAPYGLQPAKALAAGADLPAMPFGELYEALERLIPVVGE